MVRKTVGGASPGRMDANHPRPARRCRCGMAAVLLLGTVTSLSLHAHDRDLGAGHVPANVNYGFRLVGQSTLAGVKTGHYTDVWAHRGFAYVGSYQDPVCDTSGIYITDLATPELPRYLDMIPSPPGTRINDVKILQIGARDILFHSMEPCTNPETIPAAERLDANGKPIRGLGGVSIWDVSDPASPQLLRRNFVSFSVHNTYPWRDASGRSWLALSDNENFNDVHFYEVTQPENPRLAASTGMQNWLQQHPEILEDGQIELGLSAYSMIHDVSVRDIDPGPEENWRAAVSYWDAGTILIDVNDPDQPVFLGDSSYPARDDLVPEMPSEGNAHTALLGGPAGERIYAGDEDFEPFRSVLVIQDTVHDLMPGSRASRLQPFVPGDEAATATFVGDACSPLSSPTPAPERIALAVRGNCSFARKARLMEQAGYRRGLVMNASGASACEYLEDMQLEDAIPMGFIRRSTGFALLGLPGYDSQACTAGAEAPDLLPPPGTVAGPFLIRSAFDGWAYLRVLHGGVDPIQVPRGMGEGAQPAISSSFLDEIGYYAPAEAADPELASGAGDLSIHNLITDPANPDRVFISWYSLGLRAVEWRPGHLHENGDKGGVLAWNLHEVGRFIADETHGSLNGSNFWGVATTESNGRTLILASDIHTGLWIFEWQCEDVSAQHYCNAPPGTTPGPVPVPVPVPQLPTPPPVTSPVTPPAELPERGIPFSGAPLPHRPQQLTRLPWQPVPVERISRKPSADSGRAAMGQLQKPR